MPKILEQNTEQVFLCTLQITPHIMRQSPRQEAAFIIAPFHQNRAVPQEQLPCNTIEQEPGALPLGCLEAIVRGADGKGEGSSKAAKHAFMRTMMLLHSNGMRRGIQKYRVAETTRYMFPACRIYLLF